MNFSYLLVVAFILVSPTAIKAEGVCKVVGGYNLCEDAKIIAQNESRDIGKYHPSVEYVLKDAFAENMRVTKLFENISTKKEFDDKLAERIAISQMTALTVGSLKDELKNRSTVALCKFYERDEFVNDGGSFLLHYQYKGGEVFYSVLIEQDYCGEYKPQKKS